MQILDSSKKYIVNLKEATYNYTLFQEYRLLYTYAIKACQYKAEDPYKLFVEEYKVYSYREMYKHFL